MLRRLAAFVLLLIGITAVVFLLTQLVPSNAVATNLGEQAAGDPEAVAAFKHHYGLDRPLPARYLLYLNHVLHGDLGQSSLTHQAVTQDLRIHPGDGWFALYSVLFAAFVGVAFGVIAALRRNRLTDHALRVTSLAGISMPTFWIALVALYVGFYKLNWFPGAGRLDPGVDPPKSVTGLYTIDALLQGDFGLFGQAFHHLILPALVLAAFNVSLLTRFTRSAVLEVMGNDYVRAGRAKGLPGHIVVVRYILRAALPSVITVLGLVFANVLTGAVLVEKIFSWPGIGQYAYEAAINLDVPAIAGVSIFVAFVYVTINFIVDILYGISIRGSGSHDRAEPRSAGAASALHDLGGLAPAARDHRRRHRRHLDPGRDLRAADRALRPSRSECRCRAEPVMVAPLRHRRARPRRLQPGRLRLAGVAPDRARAGHSRGDDRQHGGRDRRLPPRPRRRDPDAAHRPRLRVSADHPGDGRRRRPRPRPPQRGARDRCRRVALIRASLARAGALRRRIGVRAVGAAARRLEPQDALSRHPPERRRPDFVLATLDLANAILLLSGLSFLGLGAERPEAEWGAMVAEGTQYFQWWWIGTFPGLAIFTVVLAFNFLGDSLRDVFDPRTARRVEEGP